MIVIAVDMMNISNWSLNGKYERVPNLMYWSNVAWWGRIIHCLNAHVYDTDVRHHSLFYLVGARPGGVPKVQAHAQNQERKPTRYGIKAALILPTISQNVVLNDFIYHKLIIIKRIMSLQNDTKVDLNLLYFYCGTHYLFLSARNWK